MLASIWFAIETRPCRITSSVIGSMVRAGWATSCMWALPLFVAAWRHVKRAPGRVKSSAPEKCEGFVGGAYRPGAAAEEQWQERALARHLMAGAVHSIERHRAAGSAKRPFEPRHLHP